MILGKTIFAIDSNTAGCPSRIVVGGIPPIFGNTMKKKSEYFTKNLDFIRTALCLEPRGLPGVVCAIVTPPTDPKANLGVLYMDADYHCIPTCGSATMGLVTAAIEYGLVDPVEPVTTVVLDTVAGLVTARAKIEGGSVESVSLLFPPFFHYKSFVVDVPNIGRVPMDLASSEGSSIALVSSVDIGVSVDKKNKSELMEIAMKIRETVKSKFKVKEHFLVRIFNRPTSDGKRIKSLTMVAPGERGVDRSPCGTGTSAHTAVLYAKKKIKLNHEISHESITGGIFRAKAVALARVDKFDAIIPEITGSAYTIGINTLVLSPNDPFKHGFSL